MFCEETINVAIEPGRSAYQTILFPSSDLISFPGVGQIVFPKKSVSSYDASKRICLPYMNVAIEAGTYESQIIDFPNAGTVLFPGVDQIVFPKKNVSSYDASKRICKPVIGVAISKAENQSHIINFPASGVISFAGAGQIIFP